MHWMVIVVFVAFMTFVVMSSGSKITSKVTGEWQTQFLRENYLKAEQDLLHIQAIAMGVASETIFSLAENGGFVPGEALPCGSTDGVSLWNEQERWCLPAVVSNANTLGTSKLGLELPTEHFSSVEFSDGLFRGKGDLKKITSEVGEYTYESSFSVPTSYSFDVYVEIEEDAQSLVARCARESMPEDLRVCIEQEKPRYWRIGICGESGKTESLAQQVIFCVQSPGEVYLSKKGGSRREMVEYQFALDFTINRQPRIEDLVAQRQSVHDTFITFSIETGSASAESYILYYTNWPIAMTKQGKAQDIFQTMPKGDAFGFFAKEVVLEKPDFDECPVPAMGGRVILCQGEIIYILSERDFVVEEDYYFAVAPVVSGKEGDIGGFVQASSGALTS